MNRTVRQPRSYLYPGGPNVCHFLTPSLALPAGSTTEDQVGSGLADRSAQRTTGAR